LQKRGQSVVNCVVIVVILLVVIAGPSALGISRGFDTWGYFTPAGKEHPPGTPMRPRLIMDRAVGAKEPSVLT
jgi:hypothetical protein